MIEEIEYTLTVNVEDAITQMQKVERIALRLLSLIKRASGSESLDILMRKLQEIIIMARTAQLALSFMAMATPYGLISGGLLGVSLFSSAIYDSSRGY